VIAAGREGRGRSQEGIAISIEPRLPIIPAAQVFTKLQLYGWRPFQDEPDPRPLPEALVIGGAVSDIFDALIATLQDIHLESGFDDLL
jgi:hypothetical protein